MKDDFNLHVFYKAHFTIALANDFEKEDLHWILVSHIKNWITHKYNQFEERITTKPWEWTRFKKTGTIKDLASKPSVHCDSVFYKPESDWESEVDFAWGCKISEWQYSQNNPTRNWTTDIGVEFFEQDLAAFSFVVSFNDLTSWYFGEPLPEPSPNVPGLIRNILNDSRLICFVGSDRLQTSPKRLEKGDWLEFLKLIAREDRLIPIIYLSPFNQHSRAVIDALSHFSYKPNPKSPTQPLLDPKGVFESVCGNALVYYSTSLDFSDEMFSSPELPYTFRCQDGVVKVYKPGVPLTKRDGGANRFLSIEQLLSHDQNYWLKILRTAFAQGVHRNDKLFLYEDCRRLVDERAVREKFLGLAKTFEEENLAKEKERQAALQEAQASVEKTKSLLAEIDVATAERTRAGEKANELEAKYSNEVHARLQAEERLVRARTDLNDARDKEKEAVEMAKLFSVDLEQVKKEKESIAAELNKAKHDVVALQSQLSNRKAMASIRGTARKYSVGPFPTNLIDVIHWAQELLPNLVFLDNALKTAEDLGSRDPAFLWEMLCALNTDLFKLVFGSNQMDYVKEFNQSHSTMKLATERHQTRKDASIRQSRTDVYKSKRFTFWTHLKDSSGKPSELIRIYFDFVQDEKKVLIYSVGPHEETAGTRKNGH